MEISAAAKGLILGRARLVEGLVNRGLTHNVIDAVFARHTLVRYRKEARIFTPGSPADVIFVVLGGLVKIYCAERVHERVLITLAGPGDIIGYADFSDSRGCRSQLFAAVAQTTATIAIITREHLLRVLRSLDSDAVLALGEGINSMWALSLHRCARFLGMNLRARLSLIFAELAERFGVADPRGVLLPLGLGQKELAEMIGGSRPMVSKLLIELTRDGFIARQGRQYIVCGAVAKPDTVRSRPSELADFRRKRSTPYLGENIARSRVAAGNRG
jgi:CRP/FNR family transcriptional regulator, cyclic AMP receptor protein